MHIYYYVVFVDIHQGSARWVMTGCLQQAMVLEDVIAYFAISNEKKRSETLLLYLCYSNVASLSKRSN